MLGMVRLLKILVAIPVSLVVTLAIDPVSLGEPRQQSSQRTETRAAALNPRTFRFEAFLSRKECPVVISKLQYHDFDADKIEEVLVEGSTCDAGNGGPDIHAVYKVVSESNAVELPIDDGGGSFEGRKLYNELVGNRNYFMYVDEGGRLVEEFHDSSERPPGESPLILYFRWDGKRFTLADVRRHIHGRF
jgi:hypothetical protein